MVQSFSKTLCVMDVRAENRGHPHQEVRFPAAPVMGRNFSTQGRPGVRVRNVRGKSGPKSLCLCCFSSLSLDWSFPFVVAPLFPLDLRLCRFPEQDQNRTRHRDFRARQKGDSKREKPDPERTFSQIFADFRWFLAHSIKGFGSRRFAQKTAGNRRFPAKIGLEKGQRWLPLDSGPNAGKDKRCHHHAAAPKGPFRTKNATALESAVFCHGRSVLLSVPFSRPYFLRKSSISGHFP